MFVYALNYLGQNNACVQENVNAFPKQTLLKIRFTCKHTCTRTVGSNCGDAFFARVLLRKHVKLCGS